MDSPYNCLHKLFFICYCCFIRDEIRLFEIRWGEETHLACHTLTEKITSFIHSLAVPESFVSTVVPARLINVLKTSIRLGATLLGETPANPCRTARMSALPCTATSAHLRGISSAVSALRWISDDCFLRQQRIKSPNWVQLTMKLHAAANEYRSCKLSAVIAHCIKASKAPSGNS